MTPELYRRINALADAALEMSGEARARFLDSECAGDPELRRQVGALLDAHAAPDRLMEAPILSQLAHDIAAAPNASDLTGRKILQYEVLSRLGSGGIGEVWLARDLRLTRQVALKLLSPMLAGDPSHIRRFQREARAASSLNHPNIVTIYEIGNADGFDFIAQELVAGQTLRQLLSAGPLELTTVLDIGAQVAAALAAAHAAGIVHRDIKPENIMVRPEGLVKVLDFGLARFVERPAQSTASRSRNASITHPGFVLGTAKYMSPEQARGRPVDARSDIFSLGVVLYEMLSGTSPFGGETPSDVLAAILANDPPPISRLLPNTPPAFEAILSKCLQKDAAARYDSAQSLHVDLERLLRRVRYPSQLTPDSDELLLSRDEATRQLALGKEDQARRRRWPIAALAALIPLAVLLLWRFGIRGLGNAGPSPFSSMTVTRLITQGLPEDAAVSPDGARVAYVLDEAGGSPAQGQSLWMRQMATSRETRILGPEDGQHVDLSFSPDGAYLFYRRDKANGKYALYRVTAEGNDLVRIHDNLASSAALSPDGEQCAYVQIDSMRQESSLVVANIDGSGERKIGTRRRPRYFSRRGLAWAPDGRSIVCAAGSSAAYTDRAFHLVTVRVSDGREKELGSHQWFAVGSISWPAHGGRLYLSATDRLDDAHQIWSVAVDSGETSRVTNDLGDHRYVSLTSDGRTIVALETVNSFDLWVAPHGDAHRAVQVTSGNVRSFNGLAWTPDGRIVYSALAGEYRNIWIVDASGENLRQLTSGPDNKYEVAVTSDGKYILYHSHGNIWRMGIDGSNPVQLTHAPNDVHPEPSPDGRRFYYASFGEWSPGIGGKPTLWEAPVEGGAPAQLSDIAASVPKISADGRLIACEYFPGIDPQLSPHYIAILSSRGGEPIKVIDNAPEARSYLSWAPDGRAIEYSGVGGRAENIWRMPLSGGPPQRVTDFNSGIIAGYAWSPNGGQLALARGSRTRDIVVIRAAAK